MKPNDKIMMRGWCFAQAVSGMSELDRARYGMKGSMPLFKRAPEYTGLGGDWMTEVLYAKGPHSDESNLEHVAYFNEKTKDVLSYLVIQGFLIGGYRDLGQVRPSGRGLVLRHPFVEYVKVGDPPRSTLPKSSSLEHTFASANYPKGTINDEDVEWLFTNRDGPLWLARGDKELKGWDFRFKTNQDPNDTHHSIFALREFEDWNSIYTKLYPSSCILMRSAMEFIEVIQEKPEHEISLDYLLSLSQ